MRFLSATNLSFLLFHNPDLANSELTLLLLLLLLLVWLHAWLSPAIVICCCQQRMVAGAFLVNPAGPYTTLEQLWDGP
jgi:hypothetical protein